ncbi:MAG: B12-binding domain-containing radical SAM protein [Bacteroidales bacterium]|nr:B12-binding domain-containing radical SAM protein [Bacteroidales bacterium]
MSIITLISIDEYGPSLGIRLLSSVLKKAGFETNLIFVFGENNNTENPNNIFSKEVQDSIINICKDSLYIGLSVITPTFHLAGELTQIIKQSLDIPVIWGGIHASVKPEDCLKYADMVCICDGENLVVELANAILNNEDVSTIKNIQLKNKEKISEYYQHDISLNPQPDYSFDGTHYVVTSGGVRVFTLDEYQRILSYNYYLSPTRGCPFHCSFCIESNPAFKHGKFRKRTIDSIVEELLWVKTELNVVKLIIIDDDCFIAIGNDELQYFSEKYKRLINLPFVIRGAHFRYITKEILSMLCDAGLMKLRLGIQTGSESTRRLYNRIYENNAMILEKSLIINDFIKKGKLRYIMYDIILDNPLEKEEDLYETFKLILSLPKPFGLYIFSLRFYPGTEIYALALEKKLINDNQINDAYLKDYFTKNNNHYNKVFLLINKTDFPKIVYKLIFKNNSLNMYIVRHLNNFRRLVPELFIFMNTIDRYRVDTDLFLKAYSKTNEKQYNKKFIVLFRKFIGKIYFLFFSPGKIFCYSYYHKKNL